MLTHRKRTVNRNSPWGNQDFIITRPKLYIGFYNSAKILKKIHEALNKIIREMSYQTEANNKEL